MYIILYRYWYNVVMINKIITNKDFFFLFLICRDYFTLHTMWNPDLVLKTSDISPGWSEHVTVSNSGTFVPILHTPKSPWLRLPDEQSLLSKAYFLNKSYRSSRSFLAIILSLIFLSFLCAFSSESVILIFRLSPSPLVILLYGFRECLCFRRICLTRMANGWDIIYDFISFTLLVFGGFQVALLVSAL